MLLTVKFGTIPFLHFKQKITDDYRGWIIMLKYKLNLGTLLNINYHVVVQVISKSMAR
jgi:hypothetical protein